MRIQGGSVSGIKEEKRQRGIDVDATIPEIVKSIVMDSDFEKNYVGEQGYSTKCRNLGNNREEATSGVFRLQRLTELHMDTFLSSITLTRYSNSVIGKDLSADEDGVC